MKGRGDRTAIDSVSLLAFEMKMHVNLGKSICDGNRKARVATGQCQRIAGGAKAFGGDQEEWLLLCSPLWAIESWSYPYSVIGTKLVRVMEYRIESQYVYLGKLKAFGEGWEVCRVRAEVPATGGRILTNFSKTSKGNDVGRLKKYLRVQLYVD